MDNTDVGQVAPQETEKQIPQSHVDAIVKREKAGVEERMRREF